MLIERDGLMWPEADRKARPMVLKTVTDLDVAIRHCGARQVAVQAGGNVGVWPLYLAERFEQVLTFEPDAENFAALVDNCEGNQRVVPMMAALGVVRGTAGMRREPSNAGAHRMFGPGRVPVVRIDDLGLTACDLIQLDVEGWELFALQGAEATITRFKPVVMVELKGLGEQYGYQDAAVDAWLRPHGYRRKAEAHRDVVFVAEG